MTTIILVALTTSAALFFVIEPFFSLKTQPVYKKEQMSDLLAQKEDALLAIKEIEFDYLTGKLSEADYQHLLTSYKQKALTILREIEHHQDDAVEDRLKRLQQEVMNDIRNLRREKGV